MINNEKNWWDFPAAVLLLAAIWFAGLRLDATGWIDHLELVEFLATSGCVLGLIIGKSRWSAGVARILGLGYSLVILPWQLSLAAPLEDKYAVRLGIILNRLYTSFSQFAGNQRLEDPIFFLACISILYWSFSLIAGYMLSRYGKPWYGLMAAGIVLVMIEYYHSGVSASWASGAFALSLLLLAARLYYVKLRRGWEGKNLSVDSETGLGLGKGALIMSVVIVLAAWNLPLVSSTDWQQMLSSTPDSLTPLSWQERLSKIVAALNSPSDAEGNNFGGYMGLGRQASTGNDLIFSASVIDSNAPDARFYWRARAYDFYDNGSWVNTQDGATDLQANAQSFAFQEREGRKAVTVEFEIGASQIRNLYIAGEPLSINRAVQVLGEIGPAGVEDVNAIIPAISLQRGESYRETSLVSDPSQEQMRTAPQDYPDWVKARYLQLPTGLTQRTRDLAAQVTAGLTTPYDKAEAVTVWLRQNITYANSVPAPPAGQEITDWFLFDQKSGYCNYYATAEVLLLRSLGIPARLAAGYAQGEKDEQSGAFTVLRKNSHAWPEVYFSGIGWVEFEPTAIQPELVYREVDSGGAAPNEGGISSREGLDRSPQESPQETPAPESPQETPQTPLAAFWAAYQNVFLGFTAVLLAGLAGYLIYRYCVKKKITFPGLIARFLGRLGWRTPEWLNYLDFYLGLSPISRSFQWVPVYIRVLGGKAAPGATPSERMRVLNQIEPDTSFYGNLLLREYEKDAFSLRPADAEVGREAASGLGSQVLKALWMRLTAW